MTHSELLTPDEETEALIKYYARQRKKGIFLCIAGLILIVSPFVVIIISLNLCSGTRCYIPCPDILSNSICYWISLVLYILGRSLLIRGMALKDKEYLDDEEYMDYDEAEYKVYRSKRKHRYILAGILTTLCLLLIYVTVVLSVLCMKQDVYPNLDSSFQLFVYFSLDATVLSTALLGLHMMQHTLYLDDTA